MENSQSFLEIAISALITLVALFHLYIMWFEMFAWETRGPKIFRNFPKELFPKTKALAGNQGLYNGFLAAGLIWTFFISDNLWRNYIALFFLGCVAVAGIYGALTASKKIFFVQAVPALITIALIVASGAQQ
ncbi:MAG: DUF1304 domain-containing protein [Bacteroidia bacterium]